MTDKRKKKKTKLVWAGLLVGFIRGFVHFWAGEASRWLAAPLNQLNISLASLEAFIYLFFLSMDIGYGFETKYKTIKKWFPCKLLPKSLTYLH